LALQSCTLLDTRHSETLLFFGVNRGRLVGLVKPRAMLVSISSAGLNLSLPALAFCVVGQLGFDGFVKVRLIPLLPTAMVADRL
jgi:hypothetical protein